MNTQEIKKLGGWSKFDGIYLSLIALLASIQKSDFMSEIRKLNDEAKGIVEKLKDEANKAIESIQSGINKMIQNNARLANAMTAIEKLKETLGVGAADMQIVHTNPVRNWGLLIGATVVALLDYLLGGILIFSSNQSIEIVGTLMISAILAAVFYAMAAPAFAVGKRLRIEIESANRKMKETGAMQSVIKDNPETVLPNWLKPSKELLPHNEGTVYLENGSWYIERTNVWAWFWLGMGTLLSFIRLIPVVINPDLYGENAIWYQFLILIVALAVNMIVFAIEYKRREATGLPNEIQDQINKVLEERDAALKAEAKADEMEAMSKEISDISAKANAQLQEAKAEYDSDFAALTQKVSNYANALNGYKSAYQAAKSDIDAFYVELTSVGGGDIKSNFEKEIPTPEMVENLYPSPNQLNPDTFKLPADFFKVTIQQTN